MELLCAKRVKSFVSLRKEQVGRLMSDVSNAAAIGKPINLGERLNELTNSIVVQASFGRRYIDHGSPMDQTEALDLQELEYEVFAAAFAILAAGAIILTTNVLLLVVVVSITLAWFCWAAYPLMSAAVNPRRKAGFVSKLRLTSPGPGSPTEYIPKYNSHMSVIDLHSRAIPVKRLRPLTSMRLVAICYIPWLCSLCLLFQGF
ncbi:hypothetical protein ZIOFF_035154 [Zingiber officinale]|uniref:Uncharacterized protein n=1 Tax=Zingiber officinale TaxID=94328 RepID=A0A8J5GAP9_ZINOF|nr:hypothetical protein ZIOFF_035154 [Zingiber officinale]